MVYLTDAQVREYIAAQRAEDPAYPEVSPTFARELAQTNWAQWRQREQRKQEQTSEVVQLRTEAAQLRARLERVERCWRSRKTGSLVSVDTIVEAGAAALGHVRRELEQRSAIVPLPTSEDLAGIGRGPVLRFAGSWDPQRKYLPGDTVRTQGSTWIAMLESRGLEPGANNAGWQVLHSSMRYREPISRAFATKPETPSGTAGRSGSPCATPIRGQATTIRTGA